MRLGGGHHQQRRSKLTSFFEDAAMFSPAHHKSEGTRRQLLRLLCISIALVEVLEEGPSMKAKAPPERAMPASAHRPLYTARAPAGHPI